MGKFRKKGNKDVPGVNTSSLPDIIFMLLFFFMVATTMKEVDLRVEIEKPIADQAIEIKDKDNINFIYIGYPVNRNVGSEPRIQLGDQLAEYTEVPAYIQTSCGPNQSAFDRTTSLKVHTTVGMKLVSQVKEELREIDAIKINYSADSQ